MRRDSTLEHNDIFFLSATVAVHATSIEMGFRQKDIKFMIEMFSNWMDVVIRASTISIHNNQVKRYLEYLVSEGWATVSKRSGVPRYRLTSVGLLGIVSKLIGRPAQFPLENFYYIFHFVETYRPPIQAMLQNESRQLPPGIRMELDHLLNLKKLLDQQIYFLETELLKIRQRIKDSQSVAKLIKRMRADKRSTTEIVAEIERQFPYDLNSQKKLSEFYEEIPGPLKDFILNTAIEKRMQQIWGPLEASLEAHLKQVNALKQRANL